MLSNKLILLGWVIVLIKNKLLQIRMSLGYKTIKEFAEFLKIHQNQLGRYENNVRQPNTEIVYKICKKLNMNIDEILYDDEED